MLKQNYQTRKLFLKEKLNDSVYYSVVYLFVTMILLSHSGIKMMTAEPNLYLNNEKGEQSFNPDYEYTTVLKSEPEDYTTTNGESLYSANDDKQRFWWTNGNRNNSKGPPKNKFPENGAPKNTFNASNALDLISRLLRYVIINPGSTSRMQFFNANYRRNFSSLNDTAPRAIFGGPLCFGLCGVAQLYWANSSVQFLSGNRFPLPSIGAPSTVIPLPNPPSPGQG